MRNWSSVGVNSVRPSGSVMLLLDETKRPLPHFVTIDLAEVETDHRGQPMTRFGVRYLLRRYSSRAQTAAPTLGASSPSAR